jgi:hypothetical protein
MLESTQLESGQLLRKRATATVTVNHRESDRYDEFDGTGLVELRLQEIFSGEMVGESEVRALQVVRSDRSVSQVNLQTFRGSVDGRHGTFLLQGSGTVKDGKISAKWSVVADTGTGELLGLRGEGGFEGEFGKGSTATLEYWFE